MKKNVCILFVWVVCFSIGSMAYADISIKKLTDNGQSAQIDNGRVYWASKNGNVTEILFWDGQQSHQLTQYDSDVSGFKFRNGKMVWMEHDGNDYEIFFSDGQTVRQLSDNDVYDYMPDIDDNGQVVWEQGASSGENLFVWDGEMVQMLTDDGFYPLIDNGQVVWTGLSGNDSEVFFWDGQTVHQLTDNDTADIDYKIDNGQVVWTGLNGRDGEYSLKGEIFFWDGQTVHQLTHNESDEGEVDIDNGQVVWVGDEGHDNEVYFWDGQSVHQLTDNETDDRYPDIDNGQVVWAGNDGHDYEIFFWDGQSVHQLTDNESDDWAPRIDNGMIIWKIDSTIYYADTRTQSADQVLLFDFGSAAIITDDDPENVWNNITESIGCSNSGKLLDLVTADGKTTRIDLVMQRRFNGSNPNGTWSSADFPSSATRDSLFGNTETFNNLSNILPKFKLTGLDPQKTVDVTFYASRMHPKDNRETCFTVDGANSGYATLNPVNNVDTVATVSGIQPNAAGEITIRIAPAKKNTSNKHFTYLSAMKLEVTAN